MQWIVVVKQDCTIYNVLAWIIKRGLFMAEKELELKLPKIHNDDLDESLIEMTKKKFQHDLFLRAHRWR